MSTIDYILCQDAETIVKKYMVVAGGIGIIPVPLFDQISIGALQAKMIYDLGQLYGVNIVKYRVKAIIMAILGGAHSQWITRYLVGYLAMLVPGINVVGTLVTRPALAGTITYVIGDIFIKQFEKQRWKTLMLNRLNRILRNDLSRENRRCKTDFDSPFSNRGGQITQRQLSEVSEWVVLYKM